MSAFCTKQPYCYKEWSHCDLKTDMWISLHIRDVLRFATPLRCGEIHSHWWVHSARNQDIIIKLYFYVLLSTRSPEGCQQPLADPRSAPAADSLMEIWWTVSRNYTVLFLSHDVKNTKFNQYLLMILTSLNMWDSKFRKLVMFWMWCHHDMALWCHGGGAWNNGLILMRASNGNSWADVSNHVTRLWQVGDMEILNVGSHASYHDDSKCFTNKQMLSR